MSTLQRTRGQPRFLNRNCKFANTDNFKLKFIADTQLLDWKNKVGGLLLARAIYSPSYHQCFFFFSLELIFDQFLLDQITLKNNYKIFLINI